LGKRTQNMRINIDAANDLKSQNNIAEVNKFSVDSILA
jgi:hypothetical protein